MLYDMKLSDWKGQMGHPLTAWGTAKSLSDGSSIMKIYDSIYIGEAIAEQKLKKKISFLRIGYDYPCCLLQRPGTEDSYWVRRAVCSPARENG